MELAKTGLQPDQSIAHSIDRSNPFNDDGTVNSAVHLHQRAGGHATLVVVTNSSLTCLETLAAQGMEKFGAKCGL